MINQDTTSVIRTCDLTDDKTRRAKYRRLIGSAGSSRHGDSVAV